MDLERPHRSTSINNSSSSSNATSTTSELFICFTSRLSSSSMKISSKSILSPGRAREPSQISLSSSLTRRLRSNGSMKGGQASPMFPTNGKKRGCAFENPEPSSPKVTCIGQVRVKTKKQGKKFRACRSKRRGEVSFRKVDHTNNANNGSNGLEASSSFHLLSSGSQHHQQQECKKWVHFPVTICEALRAFGAEFNCFLPCRPSCMANQRDKEEKRGSNGSNENGSSCGAVFARWLVAVQEGEGKGREIELVVGGGEDDDDYDGERRKSSEMMRSSQRRHVFEDIEINDYLGDEEEEEEKGRVSICIPPKNALLLMRCRSDPVKMAALANKFLETPLPKDEQEEEEEKKEVQEGAVEVEREGIERQEFSEVSEMFVSCEATEEQEIPEAEAEVETEAESVLVLRAEAEVNEESSGRSSNEETILECQEQEIERKQEDDQQESTIREETSPHVSFYLDKLYVEENEGGLEEELLQEAEDENETVSVKAEEEEYKAAVEEEAEEESTTSTVEEKETETTQGRSESECPEMGEPDPESKSKESESQEDLLPDCLLLMMCEPKLSMEVSKETWVCSTDFIRCVPEKKKKKKQQQKPEVKQKDGGDQPKARISIDRNPAPILLHPPRSSCSFPAPPPMATAAKGGGGCGPMAKGYESFVLTRCKSEPRRSSTKLAPDACFWKNRKLEPAALEVGAAGVGF